MIRAFTTCLRLFFKKMMKPQENRTKSRTEDEKYTFEMNRAGFFIVSSAIRAFSVSHERREHERGMHKGRKRIKESQAESVQGRRVIKDRRKY
jgi:hypothetical protein